MSRRRVGPVPSVGRLLGVAVCVLAGGGLPAPAPAEAQSVEELTRRMDSLSLLERRADRRLREARLEARLREQSEIGVPLDTLRVGPYRVVTPETQVSDARRAFEEAWERIEPEVGEMARTLSDPFWLVQFGTRSYDLELPATPRGTEVVSLSARPWQPWDEAVAAVESESWGLLLEEIPGETGRIVRSTNALRSPGRSLEGSFLESAYRELATARAGVGRECFQGTIVSCWSAVAAEGTPETWAEWYDAEERRAEALQLLIIRPEGVVRRDACRRGRQAACDLLLDDRKTPSPPLGGRFREGLVLYALQLGGTGSFERLAAGAEEGFREALSRASRLEADELLRRWRERVLQHRPMSEDGVGAMQWSALLWLVVFGALAMGSTRWRLD